MLARAPVLQAVQLEVSGEGGALVARQYRIEHVDKKPQGWQVRSRLAGTHVLRIGVPPGARRRGAGRLLEVLHPKAEAKNPRCQMSEKAKANPEELIIFGLGNPKFFAVYSTREDAKTFQLDSVETTRAAAKREAARLGGQGHQTKIKTGSTKDFPVALSRKGSASRNSKKRPRA